MYTKEFSIEAVKLITEDHLSLPEAGRLTDIGKPQRLLTELELELYRTKRELAEVKMERDILKKQQRTLQRSRYQVRDD